MGKIRVLIVEDSVTVRKRLCEVLAADADVEVIAEAGDGKTAIELVSSMRPDVITMDMMMPVMSGFAATEYIMAYFPTPILIVSSSTNRGELFKTYEALAAGALDVLEKYPETEDQLAWEQRLVAAVKMVSRIRVIRHPRARLESRNRLNALIDTEPKRPSTAAKTNYKIVALGASTGGPSAIVDVLRGLPSTFTLPIVLVLHISEPFARAFADWLDGQTERSVVYGVEGIRVDANRSGIIMAPPGRHMEVVNRRIHLTKDPERHSCRPSVDVLCESVARDYGPEAIGCLLTGMGRDGALGLLAIREAGGYTIAQDEATSVVYGMPREAALLGAANAVLPLLDIGSSLGALSTFEKVKE